MGLKNYYGKIPNLISAFVLSKIFGKAPSIY